MNCNHTTCNVLGEMGAAIIVTGPRESGPFIESLVEANPQGLSSLTYEVSALGWQPDLVSRKFDIHVTRHGGVPLKRVEQATREFDIWISGFADVVPRPNHCDLSLG